MINKTIISALLLFSSIFCIIASDRSDAINLMKKCETEIQLLEICVKNFGDKNDTSEYENCLKTIKIGKAKIAQAKYLEAKDNFNNYLKLQYNLYKSLGEKYIARTEMLIEEISVDLADFVSNDDVLNAFSSANQYLASAKSYMNKKQYQNVINPCRIAKHTLANIYKTTGSEIPNKYWVDIADYQRKIYNK